MRSGQRPADLLLAPPMDKVYFVFLLIFVISLCHQAQTYTVPSKGAGHLRFGNSLAGPTGKLKPWHLLQEGSESPITSHKLCVISDPIFQHFPNHCAPDIWLKLILQVKAGSGNFADFLIVSELGCGIQRGCMGLGRLYQVVLFLLLLYAVLTLLLF